MKKHLGDDQDPFSCRFNLEKNAMKYLMSAEWWKAPASMPQKRCSRLDEL